MEIKEEVRVFRYIEFDGIKFYPDKKGYWLGQRKDSKKPVRLHVYVWEFYNGPVPQGYDVHHIDHNPNNNEIENLQLLSEHEHHLLHNKEISEATKEKWRINLSENARPAANKWHGSEDGRKWHSEHAKKVWDNLEWVTKTCQCCGKEYQVPVINSRISRFCSNNCKSQWRRDVGLDNFENTCKWCGKKFFTNKYAPAKYCSAECRLIGQKQSRHQA